MFILSGSINVFGSWSIFLHVVFWLEKDTCEHPRCPVLHTPEIFIHWLAWSLQFIFNVKRCEIMIFWKLGKLCLFLWDQRAVLHFFSFLFYSLFSTYFSKYLALNVCLPISPPFLFKSVNYFLHGKCFNPNKNSSFNFYTKRQKEYNS